MPYAFLQIAIASPVSVEYDEVLVSDELIQKSDEEIDAAIPDVRSGMIIYNAGYRMVKQRGLDGKWSLVPTTGAPGADGKDGADGKSAYEIAKEKNPDVGSEEEWLASLKGKDGTPGAAGKDGATGAAGKDGNSIKSITFIVDAEGKITGGSATLTDESVVQITVQEQG